MLTVIITVIVALYVKTLKTVIRTAIILPIVFGVLAAMTATSDGGMHIAALILTVPLNLAAGYFAFKFIQRKRAKKALN